MRFNFKHSDVRGTGEGRDVSVRINAELAPEHETFHASDSITDM